MISTNAFQPLASIYGLVVRARNLLFDVGLIKTYSSTLPVACVGNISLGGNGKTPFCIYLLEQLLNQGRRPVLLTRGYGGEKFRTPTLVDSSHSPEQVGDEAIMYRDRFPNIAVLISSDRVAGAKFIESNNLGDYIVLDDGFQHRYLNRDVNLLLFESSTPGLATGTIDDQLLPVGRLREPVIPALKRATGIVIVEKDCLDSHYQDLYGMNLPIWRFSLKPKALTDVFTGLPVDRKQLSESVVALCAIARPKSFTKTLQQFGLTVSKTISHRDHHLYTKKEWDHLLASTPQPIITTTKDAVKLKQFTTQKNQLLALELEAHLNGSEPLL